MLHKNITLGDVHIPYQWEYANASARTAGTGFVSADLGKLAHQIDNHSLWMLTAVTPTWVRLTVNTDGQPAALNEVLPDQTGNTGKVLSTDGTDAAWIPAPGASSYSQWPQIKPTVDSGETCTITDGYQMIVDDQFEVASTGQLNIGENATLIVTY